MEVEKEKNLSKKEKARQYNKEYSKKHAARIHERRKKYIELNKEKIKEQNIRYKEKSREKDKLRERNRRKFNRESIILASAKTRAKKFNLEFSITINDIQIPLFCPVLGIELNLNNTKIRLDTSPSLDRIDNSKGYTKENIRIISWRANKLKNNASLEELEKIIKYMKEFNGK